MLSESLMSFRRPGLCCCRHVIVDDFRGVVAILRRKRIIFLMALYLFSSCVTYRLAIAEGAQAGLSLEYIENECKNRIGNDFALEALRSQVVKQKIHATLTLRRVYEAGGNYKFDDWELDMPIVRVAYFDRTSWIDEPAGVQLTTQLDFTSRRDDESSSSSSIPVEIFEDLRVGEKYFVQGYLADSEYLTVCEDGATWSEGTSGHWWIQIQLDESRPRSLRRATLDD